MISHLWALLFIGLAASPFTAPFQTCDYATPPIVAAVPDEDVAALVGPVVTERGRLTIAVEPRFVATDVVAVTWSTALLVTPPNERHDSVRPAVLRI